MQLYVASSWRCVHQPEVVQALRAAEHKVYDFRNPPQRSGFRWSEIDPHWLGWTADQFVKHLKHPLAQAGFKEDWEAMQWAEGCVLCLPCGRSAHLEAGWFVGAGKPLWIYAPELPEPELMYQMATGIHQQMPPLLEAIAKWPTEAEGLA